MTEEKVRKITDSLIQTLLKKNQDYGSASFDLGLNGNMVHLWDKVRRYRTLVEKTQNHSVSPNFESIDDTLKDIIGYAIIGLIILEHEIIQEQMDKTKNVFISHHHADDEHVQRLKTLLAEKGYTLKNSSIDSTKPNRVISDEAIRRLLRMRITWAGAFICLIGHETHTRDWVDWEIEEAHKKGKRIIGIYISGAGEADVPDQFKLHGDALVGWNSEKIIDALEGELLNWEKPDGSEWPSTWDRKTSNC